MRAERPFEWQNNATKRLPFPAAIDALAEGAAVPAAKRARQYDLPPQP